MAPALTVVACGAPLAARVHEIAAAVADSWDVWVVATRAALGWVDEDAVVRTVGRPVLTEHRQPDTPKRAPQPDAVVICPATFNTVSRMALGLTDSYPLGVLCEALGAGTPILVVPMVNDRLWGHPAWADHLAVLTKAGVAVLNIQTGRVGAAAVASGTGPDVVAAFNPEWVTAHLRGYR